MEAVTLYTIPGCVQCNASTRALEKAGIEYATVDLTKNPRALKMLLTMGYQQAPVIITDTDHWTGFRPDKIEFLAERKNSESGLAIGADIAIGIEGIQ